MPLDLSDCHSSTTRQAGTSSGFSNAAKICPAVSMIRERSERLC
jgi:hypothetical protein